MNRTSIRALIADDEALARNVIRKLLHAYPQIEVIAEAEDGLSALNQIQQQQPDLVFLDIQMPELDGLSLARELNPVPMILFTTAYHQYAVEAFEVNAVDYLVKPFDKTRFDQAISKVLAKKASTTLLQVNLNKAWEMIAPQKDSVKKYLTRILIRGKEGYSFLPVQEIMWCEAYSDYVKLHTQERYYLKNISMTELESNLPPEHFVRIHRSTMLNVHFIREMRPYLNGEYFIVLKDGVELKLSRSYKVKLSLLMDEHL